MVPYIQIILSTLFKEYVLVLDEKCIVYYELVYFLPNKKKPRKNAVNIMKIW